MKKKILIILCIFAFSVILRLWNLNAMGRTWDENAYGEIGYKFIQLIEKGDIRNSFFYTWTDEPPLGRYIYGIFGSFDAKTEQGKTIFPYDITATRLASVVFSSMSIALVTLMCIEFITIFVGLIAGIILAMLPFFLGLSQLATLESILFFFFTLSVYLYLRLLKKPSKKNVFFAGVALGLSVLSKYTNVLDVPVILAAYWLFINYSKQIVDKVDLFKKTVYVFIVGALTFIILWPMPWFNLSYVISYNFNWRILGNLHPDIEVFFGKLMHLPVFYYFVFFLITAPLLIILLFFAGSKYISDYGTKKDVIKKAKLEGFVSQKWFLYFLIAWFCIPFIQSFYNFRHHGIRFIIEIYAPFSIIAAIGFDRLAARFTQKTIIKFVLFLPILLYLFITLVKITPYYLDYYNGVVGGTKTVYEKRLFELGWWGQGMKEAGNYLQKNAKPQSRIGLFISPPQVFPPLKNLKLIFIDPNKGVYNPKIKYDYIVVNYFHVLREGFNDSGIKADYKLIYTVKADGGVLVSIYAKK